MLDVLFAEQGEGKENDRGSQESWNIYIPRQLDVYRKVHDGSRQPREAIPLRVTLKVNKHTHDVINPPPSQSILLFSSFFLSPRGITRIPMMMDTRVSPAWM